MHSWARVRGSVRRSARQPTPRGPGAVERAASRLLEAPARPSALPAPHLYGGPNGRPGRGAR